MERSWKGGILLQANCLEISQLYSRVLMVEINENLEKDEVGSLGFLLRDYAPRMKMAKDKVCFLLAFSSGAKTSKWKNK